MFSSVDHPIKRPDTGPRLKHACTRRWTVDEYHRLCDSGFFGPDERLELIEGQIVRMMPQGRLHTVSVARANRTVVRYMGDTHYAIPKEPIEASMYSEPKPDLWFVELQAVEDPQDQRWPVVLVIEISNTSLKFDREDKSSVYAAAGIPDYWIVDVRKRRLEVRRTPGPLKGRSLRHGYHSVVVLEEIDHISPMCRPDVSITVKELL